MSTPNDNEKNVFGISESIFLALASSSAYLFAYIYEYGYSLYFNIPRGLISIDIKTILIFAWIVLGILVFTFPVANLLVMIFPAKLHPSLARRFTYLGVITLFLLIQIFLLGFIEWKAWIIYPISFAFIIFFEFIFPLLSQRRVNGYTDKLRIQDSVDQSFKGIPDILVKKYGLTPLWIILLLVLGTSTAFNAGRGEAAKQIDFLVTNTSPEMVVLRIYGDSLVCAPLDRITHKVSPTYVILKIASDPNIVLDLQAVGPLSLARKHTNPVMTPVINFPIEITVTPIDTPTPSITGTPASP